MPIGNLNMCQTLWRQHAWLAVYFAWDAASHRLEARWRMPKALTNVRTCLVEHTAGQEARVGLFDDISHRI